MASSESKIPIRSITKMLTNLPPDIRAKLERAFSDAEDQLDYHNVSAIDQITKRKITTGIAPPIITATTNQLGFDVNWKKITDRRITHYEVQVSPTENFANYEVYNTVDNFYSVEGVASSTFVRVRGVRWNGEASHWSNTLPVSLSITRAGPVVYTRNILNVSSFYREFPGKIWPSDLQHLEITPQRQNGGVMFFGSMGVEFYIDAQGFRGTQEQLMYLPTKLAPDDSVVVSINGQIVDELINIPSFITPSFSDILCPPQQTVFGWSVGFGPGYLKHSQFYFWQYQDHVAGGNVETSDNSGIGTQTGWFNKSEIQKDRSNVSTTNGFAGYRFANPAPAAGTYSYTKTLRGNNYGFHLNSSEQILGIALRLYASVVQEINFGGNELYRIRLVDNGTPRPTIKGFGGSIADSLYGGPTDLWGEAPGYWTPAKINNPAFGVDFQSRFLWPAGNTSALHELQGMELTIYTNRGGKETADIQCYYKPRLQAFYTFPYTRAVLKNCTINAIEFGTSTI